MKIHEFLSASVYCWYIIKYIKLKNQTETKPKPKHNQTVTFTRVFDVDVDVDYIYISSLLSSLRAYARARKPPGKFFQNSAPQSRQPERKKKFREKERKKVSRKKIAHGPKDKVPVRGGNIIFAAENSKRHRDAEKSSGRHGPAGKKQT